MWRIGEERRAAGVPCPARKLPRAHAVRLSRAARACAPTTTKRTRWRVSEAMNALKSGWSARVVIGRRPQRLERAQPLERGGGGDALPHEASAVVERAEREGPVAHEAEPASQPRLRPEDDQADRLEALERDLVERLDLRRLELDLAADALVAGAQVRQIAVELALLGAAVRAL